MNIFILSEDARECAQMHCDKHAAGKMAVESAQMLSTAHRMLDGTETRRPSKSGKRMIKYWTHPKLDDVLYKAVHMNHPCTVWTRESDKNYEWHYQLFYWLCREYEHRYCKCHATWTLLGDILKTPPKNIPHTPTLTPFALAMGTAPECINPDDRIQSYRDFYETKQYNFKMVWSHRKKPTWFKEAVSYEI